MTTKAHKRIFSGSKFSPRVPCHHHQLQIHGGLGDCNCHRHRLQIQVHAWLVGRTPTVTMHHWLQIHGLIRLGGLQLSPSPVTDAVTITVYKYMVGMTDTWLVGGGGLQVSQPLVTATWRTTTVTVSFDTAMTDTWPPTVTVTITSDTDDRYMAGWRTPNCHQLQIHGWLGDSKCHSHRLQIYGWLGDSKCHRLQIRGWLGDSNCHRHR